ncbi:hypothetical protein BT96DRAFT_1024581 [Gymnopus androsaceus JB14]|uniref:Uncharacterized protein n=1 Tax=Gymnopus androsaceus JB14 TaxID=1447944 RepID=A0A6A4GZI9_9AGAR|nr:hypothetical protein BT96DRAFT_1024581 [Gymnopus androsaceus JB14]
MLSLRLTPLLNLSLSMRRLLPGGESPTKYIGVILFSTTIANLMDITLLDPTANTYQIQPYDSAATTQCIYGSSTDNGQVFGAICVTNGT